MSTTYRMAFNNVEEQAVQCDIADSSGSAGVISITGAADAIHITTVDNDENKFTPIKSKKCTIKFLNSPDVNVRTFAQGEDLKWKVTVTINSLTVFIGFLSQGDIVEPFQYQLNQVVTLVATDGLAFLKNIRMVDSFGNTFQNENLLISYISACLAKTGLTLNINVINNLRLINNPGTWQLSDANFSASLGGITGLSNTEMQFFRVGDTITISGSASNDGTYTVTSKTGFPVNFVGLSPGVTDESPGALITFTDTTTNGHIYVTCWLHALTFEDRINQSVKCWDALTRILGHDCYLTQAKGQWWIVRVRELRNDFIQYVQVFDSSGNAVSNYTTNLEKAIGLKDTSGTPFAGTPDATAYFSQAKTSWGQERPDKYVRLLYQYIFGLEILCNQDFARGTLIGSLPGETDEYGQTLDVKNYTFDCWEYDKGLPPGTNDSTAYVKKRYLLGTEKDHYLHFEQTAVNTSGVSSWYYLKSLQKIPVGLSDRLKITLSFRYGADLGGSKPYNILHLCVRLYGVDGTYRLFGIGNVFPPSGVTTGWFNQTSNWDDTGAFAFLTSYVDTTVNLTDWNTVSWEVWPMPVNGKIEIVLVNVDQPADQTKEISSLTVEYIPYVGGGYNFFKGQSYTSTRDGNYQNSIEDEVYVSNGPRELIKGCLLDAELISDQFQFIPVGQFYEGQEYVFPSDAISAGRVYDYGELQVRAVHNQNRNGDELYHASCQGLGAGQLDADSADGHQDIIHRYFNRDLEPSTNQKVLQLVSQDVDLRNCEWTGTLIKNFDNDLGFNWGDTVAFKFESDTSFQP